LALHSIFVPEKATVIASLWHNEYRHFAACLLDWSAIDVEVRRVFGSKEHEGC